MVKSYMPGTVNDTDKLNGITNTINNKIIYKNYVSATEVTASVSAWTDTVKTFTITHPANSVLIGVYFQGDMKSSEGGSPAAARIHISGATLGDTYLFQVQDTAVGFALQREIHWVSGSSAAVNACALYLNDSTYTTSYANIGPINLNLPDTSTTFTIQLTSNNDNTKTAYLQNTNIRCIIAYATTV